MTHVLERVAALLLRETGIRIERSQYTSLGSALARAAPGGDAESFLLAAEDPIRGREAIARLIDAVTIKETFFVRESRQLDAIPWPVLLDRARAAGSQDLRVWSAACATGEEAYTLAMLASEALGADAPVSILATDISTAALEGAIAGRYGERSVRDVEPVLRRRYFEKIGDELVVAPRLRRFVRLAQHNLAQDPIPPLGEAAFDLILCRNVLIYFDGATVERVINGLEQALRPGGMLILGSADTLCGTIRRLEQIGAESRHALRPKELVARVLRRPLGHAVAHHRPAEDALDAEASYLSGVRALEAGDTAAATVSLRRALYVDPAFGLAAFTLGRAHEAAGDAGAARRAYGQALRTIDSADERYDHLLEQVDLEDVATACRVRLGALR